MSLLELKSDLSSYRRISQIKKEGDENKIPISKEKIEGSKTIDSSLSKVKDSPNTPEKESSYSPTPSKKSGNIIDPKIQTESTNPIEHENFDSKYNQDRVEKYDKKSNPDLFKATQLDLDKENRYSKESTLDKDHSDLNIDKTPEIYDKQTRLTKDHSDLNIDKTLKAYDKQTRLTKDHSDLNIDKIPETYDKQTRLTKDHSDLNVDEIPEKYKGDTRVIKDGEAQGILDDEVTNGNIKYVFSNTHYYPEGQKPSSQLLQQVSSLSQIHVTGVDFNNSKTLRLSVDNKDIVYNPENKLENPGVSLDRLDNAPAIVRGMQQYGETENTSYPKSSGIDIPRGGATAGYRAGEDYLRIEKFLNTPKGESWVELQRGLHRMSPNVESRLNPLTSLNIDPSTKVGGVVQNITKGLSTIRTVTDTLGLTPNTNPNKIFNKGSFLANLSLGYRGFHTARHGLESEPILGKYESIVNDNNLAGQNRLLRVFDEAFPYRSQNSPFGDFGKSVVGQFLIGGKANKITREVNTGLSLLSGIVNITGNQDSKFGKFINTTSQFVNGLVSKSPLGPFRTLTQAMGPGSDRGIGRTVISRYSDTYSDAVNYLFTVQRQPDPTNKYAFIGRLFDNQTQYLDDISLSDPDNKSLLEHIQQQRKIDTFADTQAVINTFEQQRHGRKNQATDFREIKQNLYTAEGADHFLTKSEEARELNNYRENNLETRFGFTPQEDTINKTLYKAYTIEEMRNPGRKRDFIKFYFMGAENKEAGNITGGEKEFAAIFRANIISMNDFFQPIYDSIQYIGRADPAHIYRSFVRNTDVTFKVAATNKEELKAQWQKLNYLASYTTPRYDRNKMASPLMRITVGDYFQETPVIMTSMVLNIDADTPWEINLEEDPANMQMPMYITVSVNFIVLHDYRPQLHGRMFSLSTRGSEKYDNKNNWLVGNSITGNTSINGTDSYSQFNSKVVVLENQINL